MTIERDSNTVTGKGFLGSVLSQPAVLRGHQVKNYNIMSALRRRQHTQERNGGNVLVHGTTRISTRLGVDLMDLLFFFFFVGVNFFDKKDEMGRARVEEVRRRAEVQQSASCTCTNNSVLLKLKFVIQNLLFFREEINFKIKAITLLSNKDCAE